jgi:tetratricopeptide (TPR) repeat protein
MSEQLPFFGRDAELKLLHDAWRAATDPTIRKPQIVTFVAETGVGKSRIIQEFYRQLTVSETWDQCKFWPDAFQSQDTQLQVNPMFPADYAPVGPPKFLWLGMRWHNPKERNVANSLALPTLKEQILDMIKRMQPFQSRWQITLQALFASIQAHATVEEILKIAAGNIIGTVVPFADVAISILAPVVKPEGPPPSLTNQLMSIFHTWFVSSNTTPIILWLDDAQWIDKEATEFFTELMRTARTKRWPLLLIATSWPMEWNQFDNSFFLKHDTARIALLNNAADAELRALLHAAFPQLPLDQAALIVHKAGGNFLNMIENIALLRTQPRYYFLQGNNTQPLSASGVDKIHTWKSGRQARIEQRFHEEFDDDIKDFLARASQTGLDTQFLQRVLVRCHAIYTNAAQVTTLLTTCSESLAVIIPMSISLHEFRDRGYFAVAQQHFKEILHAIESTPLHDALVAELTDQVQSAFDADGDLCDPQTHPTSLRAAPSREQFLILDLALRILTPNTPVHVRALVAMVARSAAENTWAEVRTLIQPPSDASAIDHFAAIDWESHAGSSVSWDAIILFSSTLHDTGAIAQAGVLYRHRLSYRRTQHAAQNTVDTLRDLSVALNNVGRIYLKNGELSAALAAFSESLDASRQLTETRGTPDDHFAFSVALKNIGRIQRDNGNLTEALQHFTEALQISQLLMQHYSGFDYKRNISILLNDVGDIHYSVGNINISLQYFVEALTISRQIVASRGLPGDIRELSASLSNIGRIHIKQDNLSTALQYLSESLHFYKKLTDMRGTPNDIHDLSVAYNNIGRIHQRQENISTALEYFSQALVLSRHVIKIRGLPDDQRILSIYLSNIGRAYITYKDKHTATPYFMEALDIKRYLVKVRGTPEDLRGLSSTLTHLSHILETSGNRVDALTYAQEAITIAHQVNQIAPHLLANKDITSLEQHIKTLS